MADFLRPVLELSVLIPGMFLGYMPMLDHLKMSVKRTAAVTLPALVLLCLAGGLVCRLFTIDTLWIMPLLVVISGCLYAWTLQVHHIKSISVILAICGVFSCLAGIARAVDACLSPYNPDPWFCLQSGLIFNLLCWLFVLAAAYPATHAARELINEEAIAITWYIFWVLPVVCICLNLFTIPIQPGILYEGRVMQGYISLNLIQLVILGLFYAMFCLMARSLSQNMHLKIENQFLSMQQAQYDNLQSAIAQTRMARHDMRHHFNALSALAGRRDWEGLSSYLQQAMEQIPDAELNLCDHPAIDGIAGHYSALFRQNGIPYTFQLDLPARLPVNDVEVCLVISNLLENAFEASLLVPENKRHVLIKGCLHSDRIILLTAENTYTGHIRQRGGVYQSSKRRGDGVGIQSIRRIAEKNGGYCNFSHDGSLFTANVMLRGNNENQ